jgi:hypothetical protein
MAKLYATTVWHVSETERDSIIERIDEALGCLAILADQLIDDFPDADADHIERALLALLGALKSPSMTATWVSSTAFGARWRASPTRVCSKTRPAGRSARSTKP